MITELEKLESTFAEDLKSSLWDRINERRQIKLSTLLAYLQNGNFFDASNGFDRRLSYASKTAITTLAKDIYMRLFHEETTDPVVTEHEETSGTTEDPEPVPPKRSRSQELRDKKAKKAQGPPDMSITSSTRVLNAIKKGMQSFEAEGKRPPILEKVPD